jgi:hypothetical protein
MLLIPVYINQIKVFLRNRRSNPPPVPAEVGLKSISFIYLRDKLPPTLNKRV